MAAGCCLGLFFTRILRRQLVQKGYAWNHNEQEALRIARSSAHICSIHFKII